MFNEEALLIKIAQYLDLNLQKLKIKESSRKRRFKNRELILEEFKYIKKKICDEIYSLGFSQEIYTLFDEFLDSYKYITKELRTTYNLTREKEYNWLLLKYYIIPFFALKTSQYFGKYHNRLDKGLSGGDFWFFPNYMPNKKRLTFPINKLIQWLIDLSGESANKFYYSFPEFSQNTLKKWHTQFIIPDKQSIKKFSDLIYPLKNIFQGKSYNEALEFIQNLSLSPQDLKKEIPNYNNMLDKLNHQELSCDEKEHFTRYIQERWSQPTQDKIKFVLLSARLSQKFYKEINEYFQSTKDEQLILHKNSALQLFIFFQELYNATLAYQIEEKIDTFQQNFLFKYLYRIEKLQTNPKEALDEIVAIISSELQQQKELYTVDEILIKYNSNASNAANRLKNSLQRAEKQKELNEQIYKAIEFLRSHCRLEEKLQYIFTIRDTTVLHNIGDYFEGKNYLTNEKLVMPNLKLSLTIYIHNYRIAHKAKEKGYALVKVINLLTFPLYPIFLDANEVAKYMAELEKYIEKETEREKLTYISLQIYYAIRLQNNTKMKKLTKEFLKRIQTLEVGTYNPQVLFVVQDYIKLYINDNSLYNKLLKHNKKEPLYQDHKPSKFFFY